MASKRPVSDCATWPVRSVPTVLGTPARAWRSRALSTHRCTSSRGVFTRCAGNRPVRSRPWYLIGKIVQSIKCNLICMTLPAIIASNPMIFDYNIYRDIYPYSQTLDGIGSGDERRQRRGYILRHAQCSLFVGFCTLNDRLRSVAMSCTSKAVCGC